MLMDWEQVKTVWLDVRKITVVTDAFSRTFKFKSNIEAKIAFDDWLSLPNARHNLCRGILEISCGVDQLISRNHTD
jgi:hypothetical protein